MIIDVYAQKSYLMALFIVARLYREFSEIVAVEFLHFHLISVHV